MPIGITACFNLRLLMVPQAQQPMVDRIVTFKLSLATGVRDYLLTNWFAYLYWRIQRPRPAVMPDRREGITRAAGFVFACIDTQTS